MTLVSVMSRNELENLKINSKESIALISISKLNHDVNVPNGIKNFIRLYFDDVEKAYEKYLPIQENDAKKISRFAKDNWGKVDYLIVQCEAGISRSSGVAGAILKYFTGSDWTIFENKRYCPNMLCYNLVLNALEERNKNG
jgi:predicted protein tyrosine phosphatase